MLRQTHIQIVATGAVGVAHHIDGGLGILFQHHCHAGQRVSACRFQRRAAAVEGDIIRHIQNDIIAASRHANACAPHFVTQFRFLYVHVVTHAAAQRRASRRANQRAFTAIFFGGGECADACADQRSNTRANAGFTCFAFAGVRVCCAARYCQGAAHDGSNHKYTFFHLKSLSLFYFYHSDRGG